MLSMRGFVSCPSSEPVLYEQELYLGDLSVHLALTSALGTDAF